SSAPTAPISFTSPAPVAPRRCPGSIKSTPSASPAPAAASDSPLTPVTARATPVAAIRAVTTFGIRRVRRSIAVAISRPAASAANDGSEIGGNGLSENIVDGVAKGRHRADREHRDQRHEQAILEQILPVVRT